MSSSLTTQLIAERYLIQDRRGANGVVEVYDALDQQLDRPVTLQLVSSEDNITAFARRFLRRQQLACSIHHCSILAIYDAGAWEGQPFSVMARDAGSTSDTVHRPGYPSDLPLVLRAAREVAEALQCCRDAGLSDWTFAPETVRLDEGGHATLALLEGLPRSAGSSRSGTDALALGSLLKMMLTGRKDADENAFRAAMVPQHAIVMLDRLDPKKNPGLSTAQDFASVIEEMETSALQPTQAYEPGTPGSPGSEGQTVGALSPAWLANATSLSEAPTLAATPPVASEMAHMSGSLGSNYPPTAIDPDQAAVPPKRRGAIILAGAAILALLLLVVVLPGLANALRPGTSSSVTSGQSVAVPDLHGKNVEEARNAVGEAGLNLAQVESVYDPTAPRDTVASQEPQPASQVQAGDLITVSLSLGPEPQPTLTPTPREQPVGPASEPPAKGKKKGRDK